MYEIDELRKVEASMIENSNDSGKQMKQIIEYGSKNITQYIYNGQ